MLNEIETYHASEAAMQQNLTTTTFQIEPRGPFSWDLMIDSLANFPPSERHWRGSAGRVRLSFPLDGEFTPIAVALHFENDRLHGEVAGTSNVAVVRDQVARMFSLDCDGTAYPEVGERDPEIGRLMALRPGQRPLSFTSPYECAAWGVLSQRISMRQAARVQHRLIEAHGSTVHIDGESVMSFPTPQHLLDVHEFRGITEEKLERLHAVATAALDGVLDAGRLRALGREEATALLRTIRGIGPFWSDGIYLRACGIHDEFPTEPLTLAALGRIHNLGDTPDAETVLHLTNLYRPYRMWVGFLLRVCAGRGLLADRFDASAIRRGARK
jgi:DNA-3-methyladenine glycosylase II